MNLLTSCFFQDFQMRKIFPRRFSGAVNYAEFTLMSNPCWDSTIEFIT